MKRLSFYVITLLVPILFFFLLEGMLRVFGYGEDQPEAFISDSIDSDYLIMNPGVSKRYFSDEAFAPAGIYDLFKRDKTDSTFRVFIQGASSSAGFPFRSASFPRLMEQKLQSFYPSLDIEVVNTSLVATNSYTILDLAEEIIEQQPDLIIIYGGHNEFYGALGVGSSQSLGRSPILTNLYLRLKNVRLVQLLRSVVKGVYSGASSEKSRETLMSKMVKDESIPLNSNLYEAGLRQYEYNISKAISIYSDNGIPVFLGSLVSNLKDFEPFESTEEDSASYFFQRGSEALSDGKNLLAKDMFTEARNRDLLKFRATSDFLKIGAEICKENEIEMIDFEESFSRESVDGIIGKELLVEHVHPNLRGQRLMAETAFQAVNSFLKNKGIEAQDQADFEYAIAELDSMLGYQLADQLMDNWPFTDKVASPNATPTFLDQITSGEVSLLTLLNNYIYQNFKENPSKALSTARVLLQEFPNRLQPYLFVAEAYTNLGRYNKAEEALAQVPSKLKNRQVIEALLNNSIRADDYNGGYKRVQALLEEGSDIHYNKVKESLGVLMNYDAEYGKAQVVANPDYYIQVLEAFIFLQKSNQAKELNENLLKFIPQNESLRRINQRGVL